MTQNQSCYIIVKIYGYQTNVTLNFIMFVQKLCTLLQFLLNEKAQVQQTLNIGPLHDNKRQYERTIKLIQDEELSS